MNKIIAHRGFSSIKLENTMGAFEFAFKEPYVDMIELDIRMTKDKKIVCIHDGFIKKTVTEKEIIKNTNYEELKKPILHTKDFWLDFFKYAVNFTSYTNLFRLLKYRRKSGTIPLLENVLKALPEDKEVIIEIKGNNSDYLDNSYEEEILKVVDKYKKKKLAIMSFDKNIVMSIKEKRPNLKVGILIEKDMNNIDLPLDFISISKNKIKEDVIRKMMEQKKQIVVWTINTYSEYLFLKSRCGKLFAEVAITTDFPDLMFHLVNKKKTNV